MSRGRGYRRGHAHVGEKRSTKGVLLMLEADITLSAISKLRRSAKSSKKAKERAVLMLQEVPGMGELLILFRSFPQP